MLFSPNRCCVRLFVDSYFMQIQLSTMPCAYSNWEQFCCHTNRTKSYQCTSFARTKCAAIKRIRESSTRRSPGRYLSREGCHFSDGVGQQKAHHHHHHLAYTSVHIHRSVRAFTNTRLTICVHCNISAGAA